ncbi:glycosyltransferase family 39 protein [Methylotetracoccus oryzae]|uniref:glycosyltransferase family 39 protein n=1 Tax=Methylotetracoccus oryzae TaxID=1919059 RepID=UPI0013A57BA6|nr:glycosyltransferase family 39 protein [Methylotetracoccus oryzae]
MISTRTLSGLAAAGVLIALFWGLGSYPLLQPDEGRNAEIAREMLESGRWLVPTYNGLPYLDKPAFFFKAVALSLGLFGETDTAARLPSALFALGTLGLVYAFCRRVYDDVTARVSLLVIATSPLFFAFARFVIFDMTLAFFVTGAILAAYRAAESDGLLKRRLYAVSAACAGAATLVKGPVGFIVPTLVLWVFHAWQGSRNWWRDAFAWRNLLVFLALVVPWFVGVSLQHPDFPYYGLVKESFQRFTTDEFRRTAPFYYYAVVVLVGLFPWSLLVPEAVVRVWQQHRDLRPADRLFVSWAVVVVIFFSLSQSKLPGYILTAAVALGVLVARLLAPALGLTADRLRSAVLRHGTLAFACAAVVCAGAAAVPVIAPEWVANVAPRPARYLGTLATPLAWLATVFAAAALAALTAFLRRDTRLAGLTFMFFPLALVPVLTAGMNPYVQHRSAKALMQSLPPLPSETVLVCFRCYPNGWSFYSKQLVTVVTASEGYELQSNYIRFALQGTEVWPERMIRDKDFPRWLATLRVPAMILARRADAPEVRPLLAERGATMGPLTDEFAGALLLPEEM